MSEGKPFVFKVMAFPASIESFTRAMSTILGPELQKFITVSLDDFLVASKSFELQLASAYIGYKSSRVLI